MLREIHHFLRHGPRIQRMQKELGPAEFLKVMSLELDADGYDALRTGLVGDLEGEILEIGAGTGATFGYYGPKARVTAIDALNRAALSETQSLRDIRRIALAAISRTPPVRQAAMRLGLAARAMAR